jgi:hypothetical protein
MSFVSEIKLERTNTKYVSHYRRRDGKNKGANYKIAEEADELGGGGDESRSDQREPNNKGRRGVRQGIAKRIREWRAEAGGRAEGTICSGRGRNWKK